MTSDGLPREVRLCNAASVHRPRDPFILRALSFEESSESTSESASFSRWVSRDEQWEMDRMSHSDCTFFRTQYAPH